MSIPKTEVKKFAKLISDEFLRNKSNGELQAVLQDHVDSFIIPIVSEVEDICNDTIATKIRELSDEAPLGEDDDWWRSEERR